MYNIISKDEFMNIYDKLPSHYFEFIDNDMKLSIIDKNNYQAINDSLVEENLDVLKESVKLKILQTYSPYLGENYAKISDKLENEQLGIVMDFDPEYVGDWVKLLPFSRRFSRHERNGIVPFGIYTAGKENHFCEKIHKPCIENVFYIINYRMCRKAVRVIKQVFYGFVFPASARKCTFSAFFASCRYNAVHTVQAIFAYRQFIITCIYTAEGTPHW